jgi:hypothetical protein
VDERGLGVAGEGEYSQAQARAEELCVD